jgi:small subunit ribosomal protein S19
MADPNAPKDVNAPKKAAPTRRARKKKATVEGGARRGKEFLYRGHAMEELRAMSQDDLVQLLPARARRFFGRGMDDISRKFFEKVQTAAEGDEVRTHLRDFPITPHFVGKTVMVHNGKEWQKVVVVPEMIGHKLGEFALTRKSVKHTGPGVGATRSSKFMPLK